MNKSINYKDKKENLSQRIQYLLSVGGTDLIDKVSLTNLFKDPGSNSNDGDKEVEADWGYAVHFVDGEFLELSDGDDLPDEDLLELKEIENAVTKLEEALMHSRRGNPVPYKVSDYIP